MSIIWYSIVNYLKLLKYFSELNHKLLKICKNFASLTHLFVTSVFLINDKSNNFPVTLHVDFFANVLTISYSNFITFKKKDPVPCERSKCLSFHKFQKGLVIRIWALKLIVRFYNTIFDALFMTVCIAIVFLSEWSILTVMSMSLTKHLSKYLAMPNQSNTLLWQ